MGWRVLLPSSSSAGNSTNTYNALQQLWLYTVNSSKVATVRIMCIFCWLPSVCYHHIMIGQYLLHAVFSFWQGIEMHVHTAPTVDPTLCIQGNHTCRLCKVNITPTDTEEWNGYFYRPLLAAYGIAETLETLKTSAHQEVKQNCANVCVCAW